MKSAPRSPSLAASLVFGVGLLSFIAPALAATPAVTPLRSLASPTESTSAATAPAAIAVPTAPNDFEKANHLFQLPAPLTITSKGAIEADSKKWKTSKDTDGTELFEVKEGAETRAAALSRDQALESFSTYTLGAAVKDAKDVKPETSSAVFFKDGKIVSFTSCEDSAAKDSIGRVCVTAIPQLCQNLRKAEPITGEILKDLDLYEMRALAVILTLRGSDHQLDNVVRFGNRLGLKFPLQTTKGQLLALAKQINGERNPAADKLADSTQARTVLEKSLPRLKQSCFDTGF